MPFRGIVAGSLRVPENSDALFIPVHGEDVKPFSIEQIALSDGYASHTAAFQPPQGATTGRAVLALHGIQSHSGWFAGSATVLARGGHPVLMPDRRGSGANGIDRGHARSVAQLLDDGRVYLDRATGLGGGRAPHLLGVSWGGKWALALAGQFPGRVASLTLSTPGCFARRSLGPLGRLAVAVCAGLWPRKTFAIPLNEPHLFTDVEHWLRFIDADPLRLRRATARFLAVSHLMERRQADWAGRIRCPVLLLLAEGDPIIDNERTLALLTQAFKQLRTRHPVGGKGGAIEFGAN